MSVSNSEHSKYWMRAVSFVGLHRILKAISDLAIDGITAGEINELILKNGILRTRADSEPSPTTLYHYRNTLIQLQALKRNGRKLRVNDGERDVCELIGIPVQSNAGYLINDEVRYRFSSLVLRNKHCRSLFFDVFMPESANVDSLTDFVQEGSSVTWHSDRIRDNRRVHFLNIATGQASIYTSYSSISAVLYGLRYWARDELRIIDEYSHEGDQQATMFPLRGQSTSGKKTNVMVIVAAILSIRTTDEWTVFSIFDLIRNCCEKQKLPISTLFGAIDWFLQKWPHHTVLIPTSQSLATLKATSSQQQHFELRRYYKAKNGPYISHFRLHRDVSVNIHREN